MSGDSKTEAADPPWVAPPLPYSARYRRIYGCPIASLFKPLTNVRIYAIIRSKIDRVSLMQMIVGTDNGKETGAPRGRTLPLVCAPALTACTPPGGDARHAGVFQGVPYAYEP